MGSSFQDEIPKARVNITLDIDTNGAQVKKELPMKLLALGNFSHGQANGPLAERKRISINKHNRDEVMSSLSPKLFLQVKNRVFPAQDEMSCHLVFNSIKDFSPEHVVRQVPELSKLLAMRHLLKDLKANVLDNQSFRKKLEMILNDENQTKSLRSELKQLMNTHSEDKGDL